MLSHVLWPSSLLWIALLPLPAGGALRPPPQGACETQSPVVESPAARTARERVERGLLPLVSLAGTADSAFTIAQRMALYGVPGVSVAVIDQGRIVWSAGYGVRELGQTDSVTHATLFQAGSISKSVAALTALRLVEQGRLTLDDDVNRTLRTWRVPDDTMTRGQPVTLRRLLSHSAGFNLPSFRGYEGGATLPSLVEILTGTGPANTAAGRVEVPPGTEWRYSGIGTEVVRLLIQDAAGRDYSAVAGEAVVAPAAMCWTTFSQRPDTLTGLKIPGSA